MSARISAPARVVQLDLRVAAEERDAHDHRLDARPRPARARSSRSCGRTSDVAERLRVADERHHELARRLVVELARAADLLEPAVVHDGDLVGDLHRLLLVVRDEDRRHVHDVVELAQPLAQLGAHARVERAERLVEEQHLRLGRERAREPHPLPLAARRAAPGSGAPKLWSWTSSSSSSTRSRDLGLRPLADLQAERDVVADGHVLERGVVLEDEADVALLRRERRRVLPGEEDLARRPASRARR